MKHAILLLLATVVLTAAETQLPPVAYAAYVADPCSSITVRVFGQVAPQTIRARRADGDWVALTPTDRPVADSGWSVTEATISGLAPDERVEFDDGSNPLGAWRTLRDRLDPPLRLVVGGDMMSMGRDEKLLTEQGRDTLGGALYLDQVCAAVAPSDPEVAVIGGDWAYDNGDVASLGRWHIFLSIWAKRMRRADGCGIAFICAIGNHEITKGGGTIEGSPFAAFFPEPMTRSLDIGAHTSFVLLNTDHGRAVADQTAWLEQALQERRDRTWRFAVYHVPAYPSARKFDSGASPTIRAEWVPLFERLGVAVGFEHHDHTLKRTHPLLGGQPDPSGVTYLGDGAWGVRTRTPGTPEERPYLAMSAAKRHAWIVEVGEALLTARAIGEDGVELDRVELKPRAVTP